MKAIYLVILCCFFIPFLSNGQENILDPVTISSTLSRQKSRITGRNILFIKGEQIKNIPVNSLDELLRYIPGLEVQSRGPMGVQSDFVLRGSTFQQVLIIIDGLRVNDPNTGHFSSYIPIVPSEIDYIEILKGASSAIYGTDAVGGVIYIVTKSFSEKLAEKDKTNISLKGSVGDYGYLNTEAGIFTAGNKLKIGGGLLINHSDGFPQRGTKGFFDNKTASISAGYQLNDYWDINFRTAFDSRDFSAQNFYTTFISDTATEKITSNWNQLRIGYQKNNQSLSLNAGYKMLKDHYEYSPLSLPNETESKLLQALLLYQNQIDETTTLVTGVNYQQKKIISNDRGDHSTFNAAPFIGITKNYKNQLFIHPSIQTVFYKQGKAQFVPQLDISYSKKLWVLRGSIGKTIREADFTEMYNNYNKPLVKSGRIGNPNLAPETSLSYEIGASLFLEDEIKISATYFQRFQQNVIDYVITPYADMPRKENLVENGTYALAKNIATVNTNGVELDIHYNKKLNSKQSIFASLGMVGLNSKIPDGIESFYISSHAKFLTNFCLVFQSGNFSLGLNGLYKTRNEQLASDIKAEISKDYFILNSKIGYAILKKSLTFFVEVDNIFNKKYSDLLGAEMPGRWAMGGIRYQFIK